MKIGAVSYVNAWPLIKPLQNQVLTLPPADLVPKILSGELDVALLPTFSIIRHKLRMHPDAGIIGCDGLVKSVGFFTRSFIEDLSQIKSIYLDPESRSSVYLSKIILKTFYHLNLKDLEFVHEDNRFKADAQVLIGDKALFFDFKKHPYTYHDIGALWQKFTGFGFMFAAWASKRALSAQEIQLLIEAKQQGLSQLEKLSFQVPAENRALVLDYWDQNIKYEPTDLIREGFKMYKELLAQYNYCEPPLSHQQMVA